MKLLKTRITAGGIKNPVLGVESIAGERIRTADVQLGNPIVGAQVLCLQGLTTRFSAESEVYS
jgi:hypothetical protein